MRASFAHQRVVTYSDIEKELGAIGFKAGRLDGLELDLVGMSVSDDHGGGEIFRIGGQSRPTDRWGEILVTGSGADHFMDYLSRIRGADVNNLNGPFVLVLTCGCILMEELRSAGTLKNFYGVGFDFAVPQEGEIRKIGDITYCFWFVQNVDHSKITFYQRPLVLKTSYVGDYLVIRRLQLAPWKHKIRGRSRCRATFERYVVPPLFKKHPIDLAQAMSRDMMSPIVCIMFLFGNPGNFAAARLDHKRPDIFRIEHGGLKSGYHDLLYSEEYFESVVRHCNHGKSFGETSLVAVPPKGPGLGDAP